MLDPQIFLSQETSYSVYLTIRKSFVKNAPNCDPADYLTSCDQIHTFVTEVKNVNEAELNHLKMKLYQMEAINATLTKAFENEVEASNTLKKQLDEADKKLDDLDSRKLTLKISRMLKYSSKRSMKKLAMM